MTLKKCDHCSQHISDKAKQPATKLYRALSFGGREILSNFVADFTP